MLQEMQNILIVFWPIPVHWAPKACTGRLLPWKFFTEEGSCLDAEAHNSMKSMKQHFTMVMERSCQTTSAAPLHSKQGWSMLWTTQLGGAALF